VEAAGSRHQISSQLECEFVRSQTTSLDHYLENRFVSTMSDPPVVVVAGVGNATGTGAAAA